PSLGLCKRHPSLGCRTDPNRGRLAEKRSIPLPPSRVPKKELGPLLSPSEDSQDSDRSHGQQQPHVKQEEDLHISIMKRRIHTHWDLNISFRESSLLQDMYQPSQGDASPAGRMPALQGRCQPCRKDASPAREVPALQEDSGCCPHPALSP
uniref:Uncharacterized protein n=1 Tax=Zonotrichia albicollis TaxID=44394 RepID=A0A8D2M8H1_ZONAL